MSLASRFPAVFSHHDHLARAANRPLAPFMGEPEVFFRHLWDQSWTPVRLHLASPAFTDQLGRHATPLTASTVVESYIDRGADFLSQAQAIIHSVVLKAANEMPDAPVRKAVGDNPFREGTPAWERWNARHHVSTPDDPELQYSMVAKKLTLDMVENITAGQKRRVRNIISDAFLKGDRPDLLGQRIGAIIGLNERWSRAVENLRAGMEAKDMPPNVVARRCFKYGQELLEKRGIMVARTEMMRAMNAGRYQYWLGRYYGEGLKGFTVVKTWVRQDGCCDECAEVESRVTGLTTPFNTPYGPRLYGPLHPHCRCVVNYEMVSAA